MYGQFCKVVSLALVVAFIAMPSQTDADCNKCGSNGISCIDETSFRMCFDGEPDFTNEPITCPGGKICTRLSSKCADPGMGVKPDCDFSAGCGICDGSKMFTCTSRTTFAQCNGDQLMDIKGVCPPTYTCNSSGAEICVNACTTLAQIECNKEAAY